jgi:hypothetical protein
MSATVPTSTPQPVQNPLTLLVPIQNAAVYGLRVQLQQLQDQLAAGLNQLAIVHFVRLLFLPGTNILAIITVYDGSFSNYIQAFVANPTVATVFDTFLAFVDDVNTPPNIPQGSKLVPVQQNADAFVTFLNYYDASSAERRQEGGIAWYSAYPTLTVKQILKQSSGTAAAASPTLTSTPSSPTVST